MIPDYDLSQGMVLEYLFGKFQPGKKIRIIWSLHLKTAQKIWFLNDDNDDDYYDDDDDDYVLMY